MNRRGFCRAAVAAGWTLLWRRPVKAETRADADPSREELIRTALRDHRQQEFRYHGHARRVEPHALGRRKDGQLALLAWQVAGGSQSEPPPGWRQFQLEAIDGLAIDAGTFTPRPDYRPEKSHFAEVVAEVAEKKKGEI